jgi:hypothetical protein
MMMNKQIAVEVALTWMDYRIDRETLALVDVDVKVVKPFPPLFLVERF